MPPPLMTLEARVVLTSARGSREVPLEEFITGNRQTAIEPDEFLECVRVPDPWPHSACRYAPFGLRAAQEIDIASVAVNIGVDPTTGMSREGPHRDGRRGAVRDARHAGRDLADRGGADRRGARSGGRSCAVGNAGRSTICGHRPSYRRHIIGVLARRMLRTAVAAIA